MSSSRSPSDPRRRIFAAIAPVPQIVDRGKPVSLANPTIVRGERDEQFLGHRRADGVDVHFRRLSRGPVPCDRRPVPRFRDGRRHQGDLDHRPRLHSGPDVAPLHPVPRPRHGRSRSAPRKAAPRRTPTPTSATSRESRRPTRSPMPRSCWTPARSTPTNSRASRPRRSADRSSTRTTRTRSIAPSGARAFCATAERPRSLAVVCAAVLAAGCSILPRNAVPPGSDGRGGRFRAFPTSARPRGRPSAAFSDDLARSFEQQSPARLSGRGRRPRPLSRNSRSRAAGRTARSAPGFLNGWTRTGTRPVFKIVTGVSTGALIAPFAFLGPKYDDALTEFYTTTSSRNIFRMLSILPQLLGGESLADTGPLQRADRAARRRRAAARSRRSARSAAAGCTSAPSISTRSASSSGTWD